ncbi:MAG TPA: tRNA pseudouridine(38-40) synthase TruA [Flavobacteriales bacterium]|nr:tRNA pseudouridine(38-40) synthase TruA [Flavobacteriales bacterium]HRE74419.1 tRNA pseudouridine(38-40) synthase TruA [Flavobacteriales bacterium]HRE97391.1 tRNA pseudouridine(38-40) synthase TruA [Flavobacteriales bacterium]HRJ35935.1 tRNA pseudouridine(38-40) synthase TruA [Flavobacteriales bacterium]HRJ38941.1 tRNA pseudouridine(38-40) synthase TruA [Flavobacteriales bacterium]
MPRFFLEIAYDGTLYHGWQLQPGVDTVQKEIEAALTKLNSNERVPTLGCGRTDTGVHARQFFLHFDMAGLPGGEELFVFKLNRMLSPSISVYGVTQVGDHANARFDATSRTYEYHIHQHKLPFLHNRSWNLWHTLDVDKMNTAAALLLSHRDFASFQKTGGGAKTSICHVMKAQWEQNGDRLVFTIQADRFLRNMVRAIVGTLVQVGLGRLSVEEFQAIIFAGERSEASDSAPGCGLYLTKVTYPYLRETER